MIDQKQIDIMHIAGLIIKAANEHFTHPDQRGRIHAASMAVDALLFKEMEMLQAAVAKLTVAL